MKIHNVTSLVESTKENISINPGDVVAFTFDPTDAVFERSGADLMVTSSTTGGTVTLSSFFVAGVNGGLPTLQLFDGEQINAVDFLLALDSSFDVSTAAGPQTTSSSGAGDYTDGAGFLIGGTNTLDTLGTEQWSATTPEATLLVQNTTLQTTVADVGFAAPTTPGIPLVPVTPPPVTPPPVTPPPVTPPPVTPPSAEDYTARFVTAFAGSNSFTFNAIDAENNLVTDASRISVEFADSTIYFTTPTIALDGKITVELTQAGIDALQNNKHGSDVLTIKVDGKEYSMPLVVNANVNYDSSTEGIILNQEGPLKAEWYASNHSSGEITLGGSEYNQVDITGNSCLNIDTTAGTTSNVTISGNMAAKVNRSYSIDLGDGANTLHIGGSMHADYGKNFINAGSGSDNITIVGDMLMYSSYNAINTINLGNGANTLHIGGEMKTTYGKNFINAGSDSDNITIGGGLFASATGLNHIDLGDGTNTLHIGGALDVKYKDTATVIKSGIGDDSVTIDGEIYSWAATQTIDLGNGNNTLTINDRIFTRSQSEVLIKGGSGDDSVTITGVMKAESGGVSTINLGDGDNTLHLGSDMEAYYAKNNILGGSGSDNVTITGAMDTHIQSSNTIDLGDGNNTLHVGLIEGWDGESNIIGGSDADHITIVGQVFSGKGINTIDLGDGANTLYIGKGMRAQGTDGKNIINGGSDADTIHIDGSINKVYGENFMATGAGDDVISFNGSVSSLQFDAGGGNDTLIFITDSYDKFVNQYGFWLKANFATMDVENIQVKINGFTAADQNGLNSFFSDAVFDGASSITYMENVTPFMASSSYGVDDSALSLDDVLGNDGENTGLLAMAGSSINTATIDADALTLAKGATCDPHVDDATTLLAHNDITVNFVG